MHIHRLTQGVYWGNYLKKPYFLLLFIAFFYDTVIFYAIWIMQKIPIVQNIAAYIVPMVVLVLLLYMRKSTAVLSGIRAENLIFLMAVIGGFIISMLAHPNTEEVILDRYVDTLLLTCIPYWFIGIVLKTDDETMDFLGVLAEVSLCIGIVYLYYMLTVSTSGAIGFDNMGLAYNYMYVEMLCMIYAFRRRHLLSWILTAIGAIMILSLGTRGPVILIFALFMICLINVIMHSGKRRFSLILILITLFGVLMYFYDSIIQQMSIWASQIGLSPRVFDRLLAEDFMVSNARSDLADILLEKVSEQPLWGYGIAGEWQFVGWNAHNMYISFLVNFGVIFGPMMLLGLMWITYRTFNKNKDDNARIMLFMAATTVFLKGFFGCEPLTREVFFLIGYCTSQQRVHKKRLIR